MLGLLINTPTSNASNLNVIPTKLPGKRGSNINVDECDWVERRPNGGKGIELHRTLFSRCFRRRELLDAISFFLQFQTTKICPRNLCTVDEFPTRVSTSYVAFARNWMSASKVARDISREKIISLPLPLVRSRLETRNFAGRELARSTISLLHSTTARSTVSHFCSFSAEFSRCVKPAWSSHDESRGFFRFCELSRSAFDARCQSEITRQRIDVDW